MDINAVWLTVNRKCNLRCEWCYAKGSKYCVSDEMTLELALDLFSLGVKAGATNLIILGGEPTLWKPLPAFIEKVNLINSKIIPIIVTNGVLFSSANFRKKLSKLNYQVGLSLKAGNEDQHHRLTKSVTFHQVTKAIKVLSDEGKLYGTSITINNRILNNLEEMVQVVADSGGRAVSFEMCAPSFDFIGKPTGEYLVHPADLADLLVKVYPKLNCIMNGNVYFQISIPFCLFPNEFISLIKDKRQMISGCHVFRRDGIIFGPGGEILLCNCLYHLPVGKWKRDFFDIHSLKEWWARDEVKQLNNRLLNYPIAECESCSDYDYCGGGCCLQWFYFNPAHILNRKEVVGDAKRGFCSGTA